MCVFVPKSRKVVVSLFYIAPSFPNHAVVLRGASCVAKREGCLTLGTTRHGLILFHTQIDSRRLTLDPGEDMTTERKRERKGPGRNDDRDTRKNRKGDENKHHSDAPFLVSSSMLAKVSCMFLAVFISSLRISSSAWRLAVASASACPPAEVQHAEGGRGVSEPHRRAENKRRESRNTCRREKTSTKKKRRCCAVSGRGPTNTAACSHLPP